MKMSGSFKFMHMPVSIPNKPLHHSCTFHGVGALNRPPCSVLLSSTTTLRSFSLRCSSQPSTVETTRIRPSANYKPPFWDFNYIHSLPTKYTEERERERLSWRCAELIEQVKTTLLHQEMKGSTLIGLLELIDDLQRLGISHHFDHEIKQILNSIYNNDEGIRHNNLYSTALAFRLLRHHGFQVSQEVFDCFKNEKGDFKPSLRDDTKGVLQLYEASFLLTQGEETLEMANQFSTKILQTKLDDEEEIGMDDEEALECIRNALELPIHWRIQRPNARWYIEAYGRRSQSQMNEIVLQLAKLDFNILQSIHQQELKLISGWWKETRLSEKLPFARDRVVECYLWALGVFQSEEEYYGQYSRSRLMATKANILITILDDIFDVYATLEELHLFNHIIQRWDIEAMEQLPKYMQIYFLSLNNFINDMAYHVLKEQDTLVIQHLRKSWKDLCTSFLQEAEWQVAGHTPTLDEYINNAWISSSGHVILTHAFFLITNPIHKETVESLYKYPDLVRCPSMLLRLTNDLATSPDEMERGEVAESVQCYMKEYGASMEEGREHVKLMICESWKKMNQERLVLTDSHQFSQTFITCAVDLGRSAQYMYQHGDGHGIQNPQIKHRISSLLFQPID